MTLAGRTLGRYQLEALLGHGGMAEVYRARDTKLARTVALKVIHATYATDPQFLGRFLIEAQLVARLEHPAILPVYDFGEEGGLPFLVMPYLEGGTLRDRLAGGPVPLGEAAAWIGQLAGALDFAHAAGVLHRDVKPANVLIGKGERLALADFGIAKILERTTGLTSTGMVIGTPVYMAPEQAQGKPASPASDRYALAVMAYEILSGQPPFDGESALALMHQHVTSPVPALSSRVRGLPAGLDRVLERALSKDPGDRHPTCRAFAEELAGFLPTGAHPAVSSTSPWTPAGGTELVPPPASLRRPAPSTAAETLPTVRQGASRPSGAPGPSPAASARRNAFLVAGASALLVGGAIAGRLLLREAPEAAPPGPSPVAPTAAPVAAATVPPRLPPVQGVEGGVTVVEVTPVPMAGTAGPTAVPTVPLGPAPRAAGSQPFGAAPPAGAAMPDVPPPPPPPEALGPGPGPGGAAGDARHLVQRALDVLEPRRKPDLRLKRDDFLEAQRLAGEALRIDPADPVAASVKEYAGGGVAYAEGRRAEAREALKRIVHEVHGPIDVRGKRLLDDFLATLPQDQKQRMEPLVLAVAYGDAVGEADRLFTGALEADPRDDRVLMLRAQLRRAQGRHEEALSDAAAALETAPAPARPRLARFAAEECRALGRADEACRGFDRQAAAAPPDGRPYLRRDRRPRP